MWRKAVIPEAKRRLTNLKEEILRVEAFEEMSTPPEDLEEVVRIPSEETIERI